MPSAPGRTAMHRACVVALAFLAPAVACTARAPAAPHAAPTSPDSELQKDVAARFEAAERMFRSGLYGEAQAAFDAVRTKFPYSPQAARAELREADILFAQTRYIESSEAFRSFLRFHPRHGEATYARSMVAESLAAQVPEEWWFLPPVAEKDQEILRQTIDAYDDLLGAQPTARQAERAQLVRAQCQTQLARHELYVARFYARRGAFRGALARAEALLAEPQPPEVASEALDVAAQAAHGAGEPALAARHWQQLVRDYPHSRAARRAEQKLRKAAASAEKEPPRERDRSAGSPSH